MNARAASAVGIEGFEAAEEKVADFVGLLRLLRRPGRSGGGRRLAGIPAAPRGQRHGEHGGQQAEGHRGEDRRLRGRAGLLQS